MQDLNITSLQDSDNYTENSSSVGVTVSTTGITGSGSKGDTDSTYASVTTQSGIYDGTGGFDITVNGNTDLKGAVIASDADADKNTLTTGTLTYSDIQNSAEYSSGSVGVNVDTHKYEKTDENYKNQGVTPNIGVTASDDASSTTKSAVAAGTIEVKSGNTDLSGLSRDTQNSLNALGKIFDKKTVAEKQELAKLFGEEAYKAVAFEVGANTKFGLTEGASVGVTAEAYVLKGEYDMAFEILGRNLTIKYTAIAGGIGGTAGIAVTPTKIGGKVEAAVLLGAGLSIEFETNP